MSSKDTELYISKKEELNIDKSSKTSSKLRRIINDSREDTYKRSCNLYALSMGYQPPNKLSYEKRDSI
jgi:hypothetical protein